MEQDWCKFFQEGTDNPTALVRGFKVKDVLKGREHLQNCDNCSIRVDRCLASAPKSDGANISSN